MTKAELQKEVIRLQESVKELRKALIEARSVLTGRSLGVPKNDAWLDEVLEKWK